MLSVQIVGLVIVAVGLGLFVADQLLGRGRGTAGGGIWRLQISGPPGLLLAVIGILVFLFPLSPWWPEGPKGPTPTPSASTSPPIADGLVNGTYRVNVKIQEVKGWVPGMGPYFWTFTDPDVEPGSTETELWKPTQDRPGDPIYWNAEEDPNTKLQNKFDRLDRDDDEYMAYKASTPQCPEGQTTGSRTIVLGVKGARDLGGVWTASEIGGEISIHWTCNNGDEVTGTLAFIGRRISP
jgi:hypothetical protein